MIRTFDAPRGLVFDAWTKPELLEKGGKSTVTTTVLYATREARDGVLKSPMEGGVAKSYDKLAEGAGIDYFPERRMTTSTMQKITPFLWFDGNAEEAMNLYVSVFKNSKVASVRRAESTSVDLLLEQRDAPSCEARRIVFGSVRRPPYTCIRWRFDRMQHQLLNYFCALRVGRCASA